MVMIGKIDKALRGVARRTFDKLATEMVDRQELMLVNQGRMLAIANAARPIGELADAEFQVFSQWGEDGILQHLVAKVRPDSRTFIEFGVQDFTESNCRFLMMKDGWQGMIIDGSEANIAAVRARHYHWRHQLQAVASFVTRESIAGLLERSGFPKACGILSVDIDGVDYWVLEALAAWRPAILIVEYNAVFGAEAAVTVPYDPAFVRREQHHSNLYYGASLAAFAHLVEPRGYVLVGCNSAGNNAFFVRADRLWAEDARRSVAQAFRPAQFRESRDAAGELTYLDVAGQRALIGALPLVDVRTGAATTVAAATD